MSLDKIRERKELESNTRCEICGLDIKAIVILPIKNKEGKNTTRACPSCALTSGAYCRKHKNPHVRFGNNPRSVCLKCVKDEMVKREEAAARLIDFLRKNLPKKISDLLFYKAALDARILDEDVNFCLTKRIVAASMQKGMGVYLFVLEVCKNQSIESIYPDVS